MKQQRGLQLNQGRFRNIRAPTHGLTWQQSFSERHGRSYQSFVNVDRAFNKYS